MATRVDQEVEIESELQGLINAQGDSLQLINDQGALRFSTLFADAVLLVQRLAKLQITQTLREGNQFFKN